MPEYSRHAVLASLSAALLSLSVGACGGGGSKPVATTTSATSTAAQSQAAQSQAAQFQGAGAAVATGPVRGTLFAGDHSPKVNTPWRYSVRVTDAAGKALAGTVEIQFVYGDQVVGRDTPPTHPVTGGRWQDRVTFPAAAVGTQLTFRAVVHTPMGTITLDWPIKVTA